MITRQENESNNPYLNANLSAEEHERLTAKLKNEPELLRKLLRHQTPEDKKSADALLFSELDEAEQNNLDEKIKSYLLRDPTVEDEKFAELEELIIEDERYLERMTMVESELIEDYLRGALTADERQRFTNYFLVTPERREKLKFIKTLALENIAVKENEDKAVQAAKIETAEPTILSWWETLLAFMRSSNLLVGTAAAILLFMFVGTIWWFSGNSGRQDEFIANGSTDESISNLSRSDNFNQTKNLNQPESPNRSASKEKINTNSYTLPTPQPSKLPQTIQQPKQNKILQPTPTVESPANAPRCVVFALFPGVLRGGNNSAEQKLEADTKAVELRLRLDLEREYEDYRIVVQDFDGKEIGRREKLKASKKDGIPIVTVLISAESFQPDDYAVILSGKMRGEYAELARYSFRILK